LSSRLPRKELRFALPSSLGHDVEARAHQLQSWLQQTLQKDAEVIVAPTYEHLARELLSGRVDAAWAPPFVCARIEAMGVRVLVRGIRNGASVYRAALVCRAEDPLTFEALTGKTAAWSDRDSVGGFLLPMAFLREKGFDPNRLFAKQDFVGNYRKALEAVKDGLADVTSVFAAVERAGTAPETGIGVIWPEQPGAFRVLAWTDEAPNDGVAVSMSASPSLVSELERALLSLHQGPAGLKVISDCFRAEKFELAPRMGYRALYRVALASL
jgi:phosphonate transport system substrate-binding protein